MPEERHIADEPEQDPGLFLQRIEAPKGFADGVMRRLQNESATVGEMPVSRGSHGNTAAEPAEGSAASVAQLEQRRLPVSRYTGVRGLKMRRLALIAAMLLLMLLPLASSLRERYRKAQAQAAVEQFTLAMRITHAALLDAGQQLALRPHGRSSP